MESNKGVFSMTARSTALALVMSLATVALAQPQILTPEASQLTLRAATQSQPLPAYMTPEEARLPQLKVTEGFRAPPGGPVHCSAEYEPCDGLFLSWMGYTSILTNLAVKITQGDPSATVWIMVESSSQQTSVANSLSAAGAVMSQIQFMIKDMDTVWVRDYGPRFVFDNGVRSIIDHTYNRPRPNDNALPDFVAAAWSEPSYDLPLVHGGGNFHCFTNGDAFMTELVVDENPGVSAQQIRDYYAAYEGVNLTITPGFPTSVDSTRHIDMWMMPVGDGRVMINEYSGTTAYPPKTITDSVAADMASRGYSVYRIPGWNSGSGGYNGTHYTYSNAVILNHQLFVPSYGGSYTTQDAQALAAYQAAAPDKDIQQINCSSIIGAAGAIHCIVMHVPSAPPTPEPIVGVLAPNGGELWVKNEQHEIRWSATDDVAVTSIDIRLSTDGGATYPTTIATGLANTGSFLWTVPALDSAQCRVQVVAHDGDGNLGQDASNADFTIALTGPVAVYSFPCDVDNPSLFTMTGEWQFGHPTGGGGTQFGEPDPASGYTGTNVYGVNLNGDYSIAVGGPYYLRMGPIDLSDASEVELRFYRWLNSDNQPWVYSTIEVSHDGSTWTQIWTNGTTTYTATSWSLETFDVSEMADGQTTFYVRWGYQVASSAWAFSGWNLDDIELWGITSPTQCAGDMNCDGTVDFADINKFVEALSGQAAWEANPANAGCPWLNGDVDGDSSVTFKDINPFVAALGSTCP